MRFNFAVLTIAFWIAATGDAYAYLDPGTGSIILQAVIGAVASGLFVMKIYWAKCKAFFGFGNAESDENGKSADSPR